MLEKVILGLAILWVGVAAIRFVSASRDWLPSLIVTAGAVAEIFAISWVGSGL